MTVKPLKKGSRRLVEEELLLAAILNKSRGYVLAHPEIKLSAAQKTRYSKMIALLDKGWPLSYIIGYHWFFGSKFIVNKDVLIPRPETEQLVEIALGWAKKNKPKHIVDVGSGPGTILLTIARNYPNKSLFTGIDISAKALNVAKKNKKALLPKSEIALIKGNLLKPLEKRLKNSNNILITANLPYLSKKELAEPSIKYEPKLALYGGKESQQLIEKLLVQVSALNLKNSLLLLEINYNQADKLQRFIRKTRLFDNKAEIKVHRDLAGYDRVLEIGL